MKVLIVSHNSMSNTSNMGKTLLSYFRSFSSEDLAQFYIHSEIPMDASLCQNYYRFTDRDAIKSLFAPCQLGRIFREKDIQTDRITGRTDTGIIRALYQYGEKRTAGIYVLRNLLWKLCRWNTQQLRAWIKEFDPDLIFFASGDYGFMYEIAQRIAQECNKPLVVSCVDDCYQYNRNENSLLGRVGHSCFLKTVYKTMAQASAIFTICPSLQKEYQTLFQKKCDVLYTSADQKCCPENRKQYGISYLGNLEFKRNEQLVRMGRALHSLDIPGIPKYIDVYSCERNPELLKRLTPENGVCFHGAVCAEKVLEIMQGSIAVIHTEAFDLRCRKIVRHSVSTKIADSLMNGPCLIAYGPEEIASMDYLKEHGAAYTITDPEKLEQGLQEILSNEGLRKEIVERARKLAYKNHNAQITSDCLKKRLAQICGEQLVDEGVTN